jgi:hypothetical protein
VESRVAERGVGAMPTRLFSLGAMLLLRFAGACLRKHPGFRVQRALFCREGLRCAPVLQEGFDSKKAQDAPMGLARVLFTTHGLPYGLRRGLRKAPLRG